MTTLLYWTIWLLLLFFLSVFGNASILQLLLVLFVPMLISGYAAVFYASRLFSVSFNGESTGSKNEDIPLPIRVSNRSFLPLPRISCRVRGKNRLTGEAFEQELLFSVGPFEEKDIDCRISSKYCGRIEFSVDRIRIYEFFGILFVPLSVSQNGGFTAMPLSFDLMLLSLLQKSIPEDSEEYSRIKAGSDPSEIFMIRDYREGDSIRQIHWKLTEKFDSLLIKEASLPVEQSVLLIFDTHEKGQKATPPACFDAAVEVLVSLSQALIDSGISHRAVWRDAYTQELCQTVITTSDDIAEMLSGVLASPAENRVSTLDLYRFEKGSPSVSHVFCVCAASPCEVDPSFETPTTILCATSEHLTEESDGVIYFGASTYQEDLSSLSF